VELTRVARGEPHPIPMASTEQPQLHPTRYPMLDGWRGLAALAVLIHHIAPVHIGSQAVMLFFVISGYCIAASAESCLSKGTGLREFMWRRLRRIYPPYLISLGFFAITRIVKLQLTGVNQLSSSPVAWIQNLTLTQWLTLLFHPEPDPTANPSNFVAIYWSLNYEEQFYLLIGVLMTAAALFRVRMLPLILGLMAVALAWNIRFPHIAYGLFVEYWMHFGIGCLVFYRLVKLASPAKRLAVDLLFVAVVAGCAVQVWRAGGAQWPPGPRSVYSELLFASGFALLLIMTRSASNAVMKTPVGTALAALGLISYSLYLVHQFNLVAMKRVAQLILPSSLADWEWPLWIMQVVLHLMLATIFWYFAERPFLNRPTARALEPQPSCDVPSAPPASSVKPMQTEPASSVTLAPETH
jgi:peptidoglycan/LPS O-acetylase OafA/YrhL